MTSSEPDVERAAGIITRGLAAVIDLVVVLMIMSALYGGLVLVRLVYSPAAFSLPSLNAVFSTVVTFVVAVLYLTGCWTVSGSTAGAVAMGLRVVGRRSQRVNLPVGLLRAISCVLFPIGLLWVVIDRQRRSLQDIVFRTRGGLLEGSAMIADQPLDTSTRLAVERTRLANERTLMAWIRTSTSLIAFGFTIFKFFQYLATQEHRHTIVSPWVVGMAMIFIGLTGLALAWLQHRQQMKALKAEAGPMPYSISGIMAGLIAVLGVIALVVVALRL